MRVSRRLRQQFDELPPTTPERACMLNRSSSVRIYMLVAIAVAVPVGAQKAPVEPTECFDRIPANELTRVTVVATASIRDSANKRIPAIATKLLQQIAPRFRAMLGSSREGLPDGEPLITWREIEPAVLVTGFRDGHLTARVREDSSHVVRPPAAAARLLVKVLEAEHFQWPESFGDSVKFRIDFDAPTIDAKGTVKPLPPLPLVPFGTEGATRIPMFSVATPRYEGVSMRKNGSFRYPSAPQSLKIEGTVTMSYYVDSTGRAELATLKDVWPDRVERPTGEDGEYYRQFVEAIRAGLGSARYWPAKYGGCPTRQSVQQPFAFGVRR